MKLKCIKYMIYTYRENEKYVDSKLNFLFELNSNSYTSEKAH